MLALINMNKRMVRNVVLATLALYFAVSYIYLGNPVIEEIADHGSVGLNSIAPCSPISYNYNSNIFC